MCCACASRALDSRVNLNAAREQACSRAGLTVGALTAAVHSLPLLHCRTLVNPPNRLLTDGCAHFSRITPQENLSEVNSKEVKSMYLRNGLSLPHRSTERQPEPLVTLVLRLEASLCKDVRLPIQDQFLLSVSKD